jgi:hypothetical protein
MVSISWSTLEARKKSKERWISTTPHRLRVDFGKEFAGLQFLRILHADVELLLDSLGILVAADGNVPGKGRHSVAKDIDVHDAGPEVDESDVLVRYDLVVDLVGILQSEGVKVHDDGVQSRLYDDVGVLVDLVLLDCDEEDVHLPFFRRFDRLQNLKVEIDVVNVKGDVLLRLPVDRLFQLVLGHGREADLFHDHRVPGETHAGLLALDLVFPDDIHEGVDDGAGIHDGSVDNGLGGDGTDSEVFQLKSLGGLLQFDKLDSTGSDINADYFLGLEQSHRFSL